jgi:hypothetical protein
MTARTFWFNTRCQQFVRCWRALKLAACPDQSVCDSVIMASSAFRICSLRRGICHVYAWHRSRAERQSAIRMTILPKCAPLRMYSNASRNWPKAKVRSITGFDRATVTARFRSSNVWREPTKTPCT